MSYFGVLKWLKAACTIVHLINHPCDATRLCNDRPNFGHKPREKKCLNRKKSSAGYMLHKQKKEI